ncbi:MAG: 4-alpha-glucanotransferase [Chthoniobacterales bacterium]
MKLQEAPYEKKITGILAPLFALRGKNDLGVGDTAALSEMIAWVAEHGFQALQMLPIHETGKANSPYEILSAMALEPSTITTHPSWLPDLTQEDYERILLHDDFTTLQQEKVQYPLVKKCKQELLSAAWSHFQQQETHEQRVQDYHHFQKEESHWLDDYTLYRALLERNDNQEDFSCWTPHTRTASAARRWVETLPEQERLHLEQRRDFFSYVQWIAITQWRKIFVTAESLGVLLIGDLPTGVHHASADVFSKPELFDTKKFGGAPPEKVFQADPFTMKWGQNWGIPLYRWDEMEHDDFQWWRRRIRFLRSFFHLLRIDHTLGLFRIYSFPWPPESNADFVSLTPEETQKKTKGLLPHFVDYADDTAEHRTHNEERGRKLLRLFQEEAGMHNLIAEDLGETPPYVPVVLKEREIPGFKIPLWIRDADKIMIPARDYPRISVVTYATHDHQPLRKQWETWQQEIIEQTPTASGAEKTIRELLTFIDLPALDPLTPYEGKIHKALLTTLYESNSWLAAVMITDLLGLTKAFNQPGDNTHSSWVERVESPIASWNEKYATILAHSDQAVKKSGRC